MTVKHTTITVQDSDTGTRARCQAWDSQIHLTFYNYSTDGETETEAPSFSPDGARSLAKLLNLLAEEVERG